MAGRTEGGGGFSVLDGVALVTGAAVASVHIRSAVPEFDGPMDWVWAWCLFTWLSMTSAGPYLFLVRRFFTKPEGYPRIGDRLWALAGLPWLLAAMVRTFEPSSEVVAGRLDPAYISCLTVGLAVVSIITVPVLAARFLLVDPRSSKRAEPSPWTHRFGLMLAVAWPIQCGVGMIVMG